MQILPNVPTGPALTGSDLPVPQPHWDGSRVTFTMQDGTDRIRCAISHAALLSIAERPTMRPVDLMDCFIAARPRIEAIALARFRGRVTHASGLVNIWSDDIDPPPASAPAVASALARRQSA